MPHHFNYHAFSARIRNKLPANSSAHRVACLALYRALLEQCPRINLPADLPVAGPINPIKHLIRKRFKRDVIISSPRLAVEALKVGYTAETLLRTAGDGSVPALSKIHALLRIQAQQTAHSRLVCTPAPPRTPPPRVSPYPGVPKLLDIRPLPLERLSGRRHIPHLTQTNGYAFLRARKPQSPFLSRVIRDKIKQKDRRFNRIYRLDRAVKDGREEATWESIVEEQARREGVSLGDREMEGEREEGWIEESVQARKQTYADLALDTRRAREHGIRLTSIWEEEKMLWRQERERRKHERSLEAKRRRKAKEESKAGVEGTAGWKPTTD